MASDYGIAPTGYRLPDATRIGAVTLQVSDLARSISFYRELLGFKLLAEDSAEATLGVDATPLIVLRSGAQGPLQGRRLGLYHFAILLPDRASLGRVLEHLVRNGIHPGASDHLVSEALYISDPDGLGIEIYRDRARGEWTVTNRQLDMASNPLDFDAVVAAGGGTAWTGMPSGTTIGHVHLHVGDIDDAKRFYHGAVGLDVMVWSYPGALFLAAGNYHHHLGTNTWAGPRATPPERNEPQLLQWQLLLPSAADVANAADNIRAQGYSATPEEPGGSIAIDPWNTPLQLAAANT
jgi:catechol 2,3-dioxygenase